MTTRVPPSIARTTTGSNPPKAAGAEPPQSNEVSSSTSSTQAQQAQNPQAQQQVTDGFSTRPTFHKAPPPISAQEFNAIQGKKLNANLMLQSSLKKIFEPYKDNVVSFAPQQFYLPANSIGACRAASADWLRRSVTKDKHSFTDVGPKNAETFIHLEAQAEAKRLSKPPGESGTTSALTLTEKMPHTAAHSRMQDKYKRYDEQNKVWNELSGRVQTGMAAGGEFPVTKESLGEREKLTHAGYKEAIEAKAQAGGTAGLTVEKLKTHKLNDIEPTGCVFFKDGESKTYGGLMKDVLGSPECNRPGAFLLNISSTKEGEDKRFDHALAVHQTPTEVLIMDPKAGEFRFPRPPGTSVEDTPKLGEFLDKLGDKFYKGRNFDLYLVHEFQRTDAT
ncbi:hypothetical protein NVS55_03165 [Myxococcus stipitatus]|uniref:hypothetical protein n=1 Tax=Myxococcus stipitatus TaxID=83455 RepID=UPI003145652D